MDDRRRHFRLPITLPVDIGMPDGAANGPIATSANVSAGGVYFTCEDTNLTAGDHISINVQIPAASGRASFVTSMNSSATVVRTEPLDRRVGVACRFLSPPHFS